MRNAWIWIVVAVVVIVGGFVWWQSSQSSARATSPVPEIPVDNSAQVPAGTSASSTDAGTSSVETQTYTMAEVATHKDATSCWSAIDNNVHDLTTWIAEHPGGRQAIMGICGKDGTELFHGQHGDFKRQADMLATMKIGVLAQ